MNQFDVYSNQQKFIKRWVMSVALVLSLSGLAFGADNLVKLAHPFSTTEGLSLKCDDARILSSGLSGEKVLSMNKPFKGYIDLKKRGIDPHDFDLIKVQVKADNRAFLRFSLENYPEDGDLSHWYPLDAINKGFDWKTIWIDLRYPEEIKKAGSYKGLKKSDVHLRGLRFNGAVKDLRIRLQGPGRNVSLGRLRFVKKAVDIDWDQKHYTFRAKKGEDLVTTYPIRVTNRLNRPIQASLSLKAVEVTYSQAALSKMKLNLKAGESKNVDATLLLPSAVVARMKPLYCERYHVMAQVDEIPDSRVTLLRSSDPLAISVTVPISDDKIQFPIMGRRKGMSENVTGFNARNIERAKEAAAKATPDDLDKSLEGQGIAYWGGMAEWKVAGKRYLAGLTACSFLYDHTGDRQYLEKGTAMILRAAERFPELQKKWAAKKVKRISRGMLSLNTLSLGWTTGGFRAPYLYYRLYGMFNDFDLLAKDMDPVKREKIINDLILPSAIQMRNHILYYNAQAVVNHPIMYAGLVTKNWPLVSYAFSSHRGTFNLMQWSFDEDGLAVESHYHASTIRPLLWSTELLHHVGVDLYHQRMFKIINSPGAVAAGLAYQEPIVPFLNEHRFPKHLVAGLKKIGEGLHSPSGFTLLRWKNLDVSMNWGKFYNRSAKDRCALKINTRGVHPLSKLVKRQLGGGTYAYSSLQQSIIIIDEEAQNSTVAEVKGYDIEGPVQYVMGQSVEHYPGTKINRTFSIIGQHVVCVDHVESERARKVDWMLLNAGHGLSLPTKEIEGGFTDKPNSIDTGEIFGNTLHSKGYRYATTDEDWSEGKGRLSMAGAKGTEVYAYRVPATYATNAKGRKRGQNMLMVRRRGIKETQFISVVTAQSPEIKRLPVTLSDGKAAKAVGLSIKPKEGKAFRVIVNHEDPGVEVHMGELKSDQPFMTDYKEGEKNQTVMQ